MHVIKNMLNLLKTYWNKRYISNIFELVKVFLVCHLNLFYSSWELDVKVVLKFCLHFELVSLSSNSIGTKTLTTTQLL